MVSRKISLFRKMQRGRSPSFELFQLDMYVSTFTFMITFEPLELELFGMLTIVMTDLVTFMVKIVCLDFVAAMGIGFHKLILLYSEWLKMSVNKCGKC